MEIRPHTKNGMEVAKLPPYCVSFFVTGTSNLSPYSMTLVSGFLAVISVNVVIAFYIYLAMREPAADKHEPDPKFLAEAKASINQSTGDAQQSQTLKKEQ